MFKSCLLVLLALAVTGTLSTEGLSDEPHEVWLKALEGTWTWQDDETGRGKIVVTLAPQAGGKCVVGMGKDATGTFVAIIGWEAGIKSLTDTSFHSNGGSGRIVYDVVTNTELKGTRTGTGPDGEPQPDAKFHVVRKGNVATVTVTSNGESKTNELTKVVQK